MAQSVQSAMTTEGNDPEGVSADFQSAISQALRDLSVTAENMQVNKKLHKNLNFPNKNKSIF